MRFTWVGICLGVLVAKEARAEVKCGSMAGLWNAPRGSVVMEKSGTGPIAEVMRAIQEWNSHSMMSHGPSEMSHATRTSDNPKIVGNCDELFDGNDLKNGYPGAQRIGMGASYAFLYGEDDLNKQKADELLYYDPIDWVTWVPGECKNPSLDAAAGRITCAPIPACANPHVTLRSLSPQSIETWDIGVACDPIPTCTNAPIVRGHQIFCEPPMSKCPTGGRIDTATGAFVCGGVAKTYVCNAWSGPILHCQQGSPGCPDTSDPNYHGGRCLSYTEIDKDLDQLERETAAFAPRVAMPSVPNREGTSLSTAQVESAGVDMMGYLERLGTRVNNNHIGYGFPYDFFQYMDVQVTNFGDVAPGEGVVCSTFISWAYHKVTAETIPAYKYTHADLVGAADAMFNYAYSQCKEVISGAQMAGFALQCGQVNVHPCTIGARQVVNCFGTGQCGTGSEDMYNHLRDDPSTQPWSVSPDHIVALGRHAPTNPGTNAYAAFPSPWAKSVGVTVYFSNPGSTYTCWN